MEMMHFCIKPSIYIEKHAELFSCYLFLKTVMTQLIGIVQRKDRKRLHYNATAADDLATHGTEPSAALVLSYFS